MEQQFFFSSGVIAESEDDKGIQASIIPIIYYFVFLGYHFKTLQVDNALWSRIHQCEQPHKNSEDNY